MKNEEPCVWLLAFVYVTDIMLSYLRIVGLSVANTLSLSHTRIQ